MLAPPTKPAQTQSLRKRSRHTHPGERKAILRRLTCGQRETSTFPVRLCRASSGSGWLLLIDGVYRSRLTRRKLHCTALYSTSHHITSAIPYHFLTGHKPCTGSCAAFRSNAACRARQIAPNTSRICHYIYAHQYFRKELQLLQTRCCSIRDIR